MPAVTPRLRLSIAAVTLAAALGGAFLVSSAPAQTQPKPAPVVTPEMLQFHSAEMRDKSNLHEIAMAIIQYAEDHGERLPDANHWMDQIAPYRRDTTVFLDPFQPEAHRYAYAFNRNCSRKPLSAFDHPAETVLLFDSTLGTRNASDTGQSVARHFINLPANVTPELFSGYGFVDSHVKEFGEIVHPSFAITGGKPTLFAVAPSRAAILRHYTVSLEDVQRYLRATTRTTLDQAQLLAGSTSVQGPGVIVTLIDSKRKFPAPMSAGLAPPNIIHDSDINQVVNELRASGAEAIAVDGQRLVTTSAIRSVGPIINVNAVPQGPPFVIQAIGDPKALYEAMTLPGSIASQLKIYDPAMFTVQKSARMTLPAYTGGNEPRYAKPVSAVDPVQEKLDFLNKTLIFLKQYTHAKQVVITLDSKGAYLLDGIQVSKNQIEPRLAALARQNPNITAVIQANENQPTDRVINLVDLVKKAGIQSMQIARQSRS